MTRTNQITRWQTPRNRIRVRNTCLVCKGRSAYWHNPDFGPLMPIADYQLCKHCDQLGLTKRQRGGILALYRRADDFTARRRYVRGMLDQYWREVEADGAAELYDELNAGYMRDVMGWR